MLKSSMKMMRLFPPMGPSLSLERFSIGPSMISWTAKDEVAAEKLMINWECVDGKSFNNEPARMVFPVPVAPTTNTFFLIFIRMSTTYELRTCGVDVEKMHCVG